MNLSFVVLTLILNLLTRPFHTEHLDRQKFLFFFNYHLNCNNLYSFYKLPNCKTLIKNVEIKNVTQNTRIHRQFLSFLIFWVEFNPLKDTGTPLC